MRPGSSVLATLLFAAALLVLANLAKDHIDEGRASATHALPAIVPTYAVAITLSLGMESFAADVLWLRTLEYFGDGRFAKLGYVAVVPLLERVLELDPKYCVVYRKSGLILTTGEIMDLKRAERWLKRGVDECPDDWFIPFSLGFNLFFYQRRFSESAVFLAEAAKRPGAPEYTRDLAVRVGATGGDLDMTEGIILDMLDGEDDPGLVRSLTERLNEVKTERVLRALDAAVARARSEGKTIERLDDLVALGVLGALPADPSGGRLFLDGERARSTRYEKRLQLKAEAMEK